MSSKTKIVVLRMKEIIYTAIFIGLGILLITLFLIMFHPKKDAAQTASDSVTVHTGSIHSLPRSWQPECQCGSSRRCRSHQFYQLLPSQ